MQQEIVEQSDENQLNLTPHELISSFIRVPTKSQGTKLIEEIQTKFDLQHLDAETIVTAAANTVQLKDAIQSPVKPTPTSRLTWSPGEYFLLQRMFVLKTRDLEFREHRDLVPSPALHQS
jgi:hypothetical protein